ncbi:NADH dehydrogenase [ubiquinone] 1 subunit C2 [Clupea harengus]|uniref:NADH dehydrogenase [ubiquinone] 1 subunit C2 n=1 Tax=Clupea harengus TaxID=7950 RepID=A0A6P3W0P6_CLUHA|nr:NADH dehydrogenase [ubiquinone] 1 subunit C2 [Clupea harengus]
MGLLPEEANALPPPGIANRNSAWLGMSGLLVSMLHNNLNRRPAIMSGLHRHTLLTTAGWFVGYYVTKIVNYKQAKLDRDMMSYARSHPEEFAEKERKTFAEIVEPFHPIR